jgi:hypothetical protein
MTTPATTNPLNSNIQRALWVIVAVMLLAVSCTNRVYRQTGLDMPIAPTSGGTTSLVVSDRPVLALTGEVQLDSGAFRLELVNPAGVTVEQWTISAGQRETIDLKLAPIQGTWQIKYTSEDGVGKIRLALSQAIGQ